ncbi:hypothetical protein D3C81_2055930 [compost metagenome]
MWLMRLRVSSGSSGGWAAAVQNTKGRVQARAKNGRMAAYVTDLKVCLSVISETLSPPTSFNAHGNCKPGSA